MQGSAEKYDQNLSVIQETKSHLEDISVYHQSIPVSMLSPNPAALKSGKEDSGEYAVSQLVNSMLRNSKLAHQEEKGKGYKDIGRLS